MQAKRVLWALGLTAVWGYAAATWAGIAHHLLGMPDMVPAATLIAAGAAAAWSVRPRESSRGTRAIGDPKGLPAATRRA